MSTPSERSSNEGLVATTPVSASEPNLNLDLTHVSQFVKIKCNCRTAKLPARQISSYIAVFQNRFLLYLGSRPPVSRVAAMMGGCAVSLRAGRGERPQAERSC